LWRRGRGKRLGGGETSGWVALNGDDGEGEAEAEFAVDLDLDGVDAEAGELDSAEDMDIGGVGVEGGEVELDLAGGDGFVLVGVENGGLLGEASGAAAPTGPEAELEEAEWDGGGGDDADNADERLLSAGFLADILAEDAGLKVGENGFGHGGGRMADRGRGAIGKDRR
jgi:hypothetical protein